MPLKPILSQTLKISICYNSRWLIDNIGLEKQGEEMARYKHYSYQQAVLIPVHFDNQIIPGSFEYALNYIVDNELDLSGE